VNGPIEGVFRRLVLPCALIPQDRWIADVGRFLLEHIDKGLV